jgi:signal transduction histidine kinase/ActR/RegA family two-component response regulator
MIHKLPNCFRFILITTLHIVLFSSFAFGQSEDDMLDSLRQQFVGATTLDSAYTAEAIAKMYRAYGNPTNCLNYAQMAYFLAEKANDSMLFASANNIIGTVYVINNNLEEAYEYLTAAHQIYVQLGDNLWQIKTLNNLALVLWKREKFGEAKQKFHEIIDRIDQEKNLANQEKLKELRLVSYFNLGLMHYETMAQEKALAYFYHADSLLPMMAVRMDSLRKLQISVRLAQSYLELGDLDNAWKYVQRGNSLGLNKGAEDQMLRLMEVEKSIFLARGEWDKMASKNREYENLKNTYFDVEKQKEILSLNKKFEVERKNQERKVLEKELERQKLLRILLALALIFISTVSLILIASLRARRKANLILQAQKEALQDAIIHAEKASSAKDEFLSMMSHEIRTPMNGVIGMTNILLEESPRPRQLESLNILKSSANHLLALINDILDYNKIGTQNLKLELVNFNLKETVDVLCKALTPESKSKGLDFSWNFDPNLSEFVIGDSVRISQVLNNLISNAIKFTDNGKVEVAVSQTALGKYRFAVTDTGIGIAGEHQRLIFERFKQISHESNQKYGGTGLGLTISKKLVEMMGGILQLESQVGNGSSFFFTLDLAKGTEPIYQRPAPIPNHIGELNGYTILLAEDNPINQIVAKKFLVKWGARLVMANDGEEAVARVSEMSFDAILMDIQMPKMNGLEATKMIRQMEQKSRSSIPIIALTASVINKEEDWASKNGFDGFVFKPFRPEELLLNIKQVCPAPTLQKKTIDEGK